MLPFSLYSDFLRSGAWYYFPPHGAKIKKETDARFCEYITGQYTCSSSCLSQDDGKGQADRAVMTVLKNKNKNRSSHTSSDPERGAAVRHPRPCIRWTAQREQKSWGRLIKPRKHADISARLDPRRRSPFGWGSRNNVTKFEENSIKNAQKRKSVPLFSHE